MGMPEMLSVFCNFRVDVTRKFVLTYHLEDDSIHIFEETVKNSGIIGGNYLTRGRYMNTTPVEGGPPRHARATDLFVGSIIGLSVGKKMQITEMDGQSMDFCESNPDEFPLFDITRILSKIMTAARSSRVSFRGLFHARDTTNSGIISTGDEFLAILEDVGVLEALNQHEKIVLVREYCTHKAQPQLGIAYPEFCDSMAVMALQTVTSFGRSRA